MSQTTEKQPPPHRELSKEKKQKYFHPTCILDTYCPGAFTPEEIKEIERNRGIIKEDFNSLQIKSNTRHQQQPPAALSKINNSNRSYSRNKNFQSGKSLVSESQKKQIEANSNASSKNKGKKDHNREKNASQSSITSKLSYNRPTKVRMADNNQYQNGQISSSLKPSKDQITSEDEHFQNQDKSMQNNNLKQSLSDVSPRRRSQSQNSMLLSRNPLNESSIFVGRRFSQDSDQIIELVYPNSSVLNEKSDYSHKLGNSRSNTIFSNQIQPQQPQEYLISLRTSNSNVDQTLSHMSQTPIINNVSNRNEQTHENLTSMSEGNGLHQPNSNNSNLRSKQISQQSERQLEIISEQNQRLHKSSSLNPSIFLTAAMRQVDGDTNSVYSARLQKNKEKQMTNRLARQRGKTSYQRYLNPQQKLETSEEYQYFTATERARAATESLRINQPATYVSTLHITHDKGVQKFEENNEDLNDLIEDTKQRLRRMEIVRENQRKQAEVEARQQFLVSYRGKKQRALKTLLLYVRFFLRIYSCMFLKQKYVRSSLHSKNWIKKVIHETLDFSISSIGIELNNVMLYECNESLAFYETPSSDTRLRILQMQRLRQCSFNFLSEFERCIDCFLQPQHEAINFLELLFSTRILFDRFFPAFIIQRFTYGRVGQIRFENDRQKKLICAYFMLTFGLFNCMISPWEVIKVARTETRERNVQLIFSVIFYYFHDFLVDSLAVKKQNFEKTINGMEPLPRKYPLYAFNDTFKKQEELKNEEREDSVNIEKVLDALHLQAAITDNLIIGIVPRDKISDFINSDRQVKENFTNCFESIATGIMAQVEKRQEMLKSGNITVDQNEINYHAKPFFKQSQYVLNYHDLSQSNANILNNKEHFN